MDFKQYMGEALSPASIGKASAQEDENLRIDIEKKLKAFQDVINFLSKDLKAFQNESVKGKDLKRLSRDLNEYTHRLNRLHG